MRISVHLLSLFKFILIALIPGCIAQNKSSKKLKQIEGWSVKHIAAVPQSTIHSNLNESISVETLTLSKALSFAFQNNQELKALLQEIGIKSGDLIQAGFFSNPSVETVFRLPKPGDRTNIEVTGSFKLSDFWQVPLRKKIAESELEEKTREILAELLAFRKKVVATYYDTLHAQEILGLMRESYMLIKELKQLTLERYQYGYQSDLDIHLITAHLHAYQSRIWEKQGEYYAHRMHLQTLLGMVPKKLNIERVTPTPMKLLPALDNLVDKALREHPKIQMLNYTIAKAQRTLSYERSRIIDNVQLGLTYEREFEKNNAGVGPALSFDLPIFDTNYGAIERTRHEIKKAEYELDFLIHELESRIRSSYHSYQFHAHAIQKYESKVIPAFEKAGEYTAHYTTTMQIPMPVKIQTHLSYMHAKEQLLDIQHKAFQLFNELESAVGKQLA